MRVIRLHHPYEPSQIPNEEVMMVLGFLDGVHRDHQKVIETGKKVAEKKSLKLTVITFSQHPPIVFRKVSPEDMKYLTSLEQKERLMVSLGVDILYIVEFTSVFAQLKPQDFVDQYIVSLNSAVAVPGSDYTYSPEEIAGVRQLPTYMQSRFEVVTVPKGEMTSTKTSSAKIRGKVEAGKMEEVTELLGYIYEIGETAVHGGAHGRLLGFPTTSVGVRSTVRLPRIDIYAAQIEVGDKWYVGMDSIGHNDTFGEGCDLTVEVYILDFHQNIYGEQVVVRWNHYPRDRMKFNGAEALIDQLEQDERDTADYFQQSEDK